MQWQITIPITPQAKQSFRYTARNNKVIRYQPKDKVNYIGAIKTYAMAKRPDRLLEGALELSVDFIFPFLGKHGKKVRQEVLDGRALYKTTKPDVDNLLKPLKDALRSVVYADDNQVAAYGRMRKIYGEAGKLIVIIRELEENDE